MCSRRYHFIWLGAALLGVAVGCQSHGGGVDSTDTLILPASADFPELTNLSIEFPDDGRGFARVVCAQTRDCSREKKNSRHEEA